MYYKIVKTWNPRRGANDYHAQFRAANNETVWWTENYTERASALRAIELVHNNGGTKDIRED